MEIVCQKCLGGRNFSDCMHPYKDSLVTKDKVYFGNLIYCPYFKPKNRDSKGRFVKRGFTQMICPEQFID